MTDVIMPQMGESIAEGTVTKWMKNVGDKVQRDEPLFEISTDKVDAEIPAPASGTLKEIRVQPGTTAPINTAVGVLASEGEAVTAAPAPAPAPPQPSAVSPPRPSPPSPPSAPPSPAVSAPPPSPIPQRPPSVPPVAAPAAGAAPAVPAPPPAPSMPVAGGSRVEVFPMSPIRKKTAEHMVLSKRTSAHVTTVFEIDMSRVEQLREKYRPAYE